MKPRCPFEVWYPNLLAAAMKYLGGSQELASDAVQSLFLRRRQQCPLKSCDSLQPNDVCPNSKMSWPELQTAVRNSCIDVVRGRALETYVVRKTTIKELQNQQIPDNVRDSLTQLVDKTFFSQSDFVSALKGVLSQSDFEIYRKTILEFTMGRRGTTDVDLDGIASNQPDPSKCAEKHEGIERVREALKRLKRKERRVLIYRYWKTYSFGQIAQELECSVNQVRKIYDKAIKKLKNAMKNGSGEG
ncbi:MAG: hypothetical protein KatS3mg109_0281 [Pirellulaceae bacterium]|nr:MAG: hypothetical protein KatS3mg109_0281 [Pirellulaceae bacterium]